MKTINSVDDAWTYVKRLGFGERPGYPGWIVESQRRMSAAVDALLAASDQKTWFHKEFRPFKVEFHRFKSPEGYSFPWKSAFIVVSPDGKVTTLHMSHVKV